MTFEVVSTRSWNVLGTFEDEDTARAAVSASLSQETVRPDDLVVYVSEGDRHLDELTADKLIAWAGAAGQSLAAR
jgi:hypothetical protein